MRVWSVIEGLTAHTSLHVQLLIGSIIPFCWKHLTLTVTTRENVAQELQRTVEEWGGFDVFCFTTDNDGIFCRCKLYYDGNTNAS